MLTTAYLRGNSRRQAAVCGGGIGRLYGQAKVVPDTGSTPAWCVAKAIVGGVSLGAAFLYGR